ncbi:uncharacterized protein LOC133850481 isoform X2 [Drosophila sulfurigaster albostrigata]|uniref:uncharacterized protein LOC133850481 isoform X2 n=1 Tax=Drosophila sulfurigaster albostrigata TaxID=89887 RepID=UPI002D2192DD|nr:uncharacterized protein LOC133850481 isoform X2 [Drosophila sulfurigaster albostrigata]
MHQRILIASSLFAVFALCSCIVQATPTRPQLPVWQWPFLDETNHRAKRQVEITSDDEQLSRCDEYLDHGPYTHPRLLFIWYNLKAGPVDYLRKIITEDLDLPHLAYSMQRVKIQPNKMLFQLSNRLQAFEVLRSYCQLFSRKAGYRSQGYEEPPLNYEILLTDQDFSDSN